MVDFTVTNQGTIWMFTPNTPAAQELARSPDFGLESWQWIGAKFAVDHREGLWLAQQLRDDGFSVEGGVE